MFVYRVNFASERLTIFHTNYLTPLGRFVGIVEGNDFEYYYFCVGISYQALDELDGFEDVVTFGFKFIVTLVVNRENPDLIVVDKKVFGHILV